jgi:ABC-type Fe3+/spermidine/putrescine transport system ATPase subunit
MMKQMDENQSSFDAKLRENVQKKERERLKKRKSKKIMNFMK